MIAIPHESNFFVQSKVLPFNLEGFPKWFSADGFAIESQDVSIFIENKPLEKPQEEVPLLGS